MPLIEVLDINAGTPQPSWMDPILNYLKDGSLPPDKKDARSIIYKAANYTVITEYCTSEDSASPY